MNHKILHIEQRLGDLKNKFIELAYSASILKEDLAKEKAKILGKNGYLTYLLRSMREMNSEERQYIGQKFNQFKISMIIFISIFFWFLS